MNLFQKTISILILLIPFIAYARVEMPVEVVEEIDVSYSVKVIRLSEQENVVEEQVTIKSEIKRLFGSNWELAYAVMMSESSGRATARNVNTSGSVDNGYWQINDKYHANITLECAQDVKCSTAYAYKLSKGGTNWTPWYGYVHGGYRKFL